MVGIEPSIEIDETISEIISYRVDALVADFDLKEQSPNVRYYGTELVERYLSIRKEFPIFIFTSHEDDALQKGEDVNIIYEKGEQYIEGDDENSPPIKNKKLLDRIKLQIEKHQLKVLSSENRLKELVYKSHHHTLTLFEENELIHLDSFLEQTIDRQSVMPESLKTTSASSKLIELIKKVDSLTTKINENNY